MWAHMKKVSFKKIRFDDEALKSRVFSEVCHNSLQIMAIICALANRAGIIDGIDNLYGSDPDIIKRYHDTACLVLRALKQAEARKTKH